MISGMPQTATWAAVVDGQLRGSRAFHVHGPLFSKIFGNQRVGDLITVELDLHTA